MKLMHAVKITLFALVGALVLAFGLALTPEPALACSLLDPGDCVDDILPGEGIPGPEDILPGVEHLWPFGQSPVQDSDSCLAFMTYVDYTFRIRNEAGGTVYYQINDESFNLAPDASRDHAFPQERGSGCGGSTSYPVPVIEFDNSYSAGYTEQSYNVGNYDDYVFQRNGDYLDLYLGPTASADSSPYVATGTGSGSRSIGYGDSFFDSVTSASGDRITFYGWSGDWIRITMWSTNMDTYLELLAPNGALIASNDDSNGSTDSLIYMDSLPSDGTYTIIARGYSGDTGSYSLSLE